MCVIFVADNTRPTPEMVSAAFEDNPAGAGIAWRKSGMVVWQKGLNREEILELVSKAPLPFISHYRIPSCGGDIPALCHPFPIQADASLQLKGTTKGLVLFHNGHWGTWQYDTKQALLHSHNLRLPPGSWSDSRAMAWLAARFGEGLLELLDEKVAIMGTDRIEIFGSGWSRVNDVVVSNRLWERTRWTKVMGGPSRYHVVDRSEETDNKCYSPYTTPPASLCGKAQTPKLLPPAPPPPPQSGGAAKPVIPFPLAKELFEKGKLSRSQYKRSKRVWERQLWKAAKEKTAHSNSSTGSGT